MKAISNTPSSVSWKSMIARHLVENRIDTAGRINVPDLRLFPYPLKDSSKISFLRVEVIEFHSILKR